MARLKKIPCDLLKSVIFEGMQFDENYRIKVAESHDFSIQSKTNGLSLNSDDTKPDFVRINDNTVHILWRNKGYTVELLERENDGRNLSLKINGKRTTASIHNRMEQMLEKMGISGQTAHKANIIKSPMPGMVLKVLVEPGMSISKGTPLVVLEAMKMENIIKAASDGVVKEVFVSPLMKVEKNFAMIVLE